MQRPQNIDLQDLINLVGKLRVLIKSHSPFAFEEKKEIKLSIALRSLESKTGLTLDKIKIGIKYLKKEVESGILSSEFRSYNSDSAYDQVHLNVDLIKFKKYENALIDKKDKTPLCVEENAIGYLKFGKDGLPIKIGYVRNRPFKLLQCLLNPIGVAKTIDMVFESIKKPKDETDQSLISEYGGLQQKLKKIKHTIKELQKDNKLQGRLFFRLDKTKVWLEISS